MIYELSAHIDNSEHGDDCLLVRRLSEKSLLVIICDGVTESSCGRIASHIIANKTADYVTDRAKLFSLHPDFGVQALISNLKETFSDLHLFINQINEFEYDNSSYPTKLRDSLFLYSRLTNMKVEHLKRKLFSSSYLTNEFSSTISFLYIETLLTGLYKVTVFNLGNSDILKTRFNPLGKRFDYQDLDFRRSTNETSQFNSKKYLRGSYSLSVHYINAQEIITLGSDGARLKNIVDDTDDYYYEYYFEFSEMLSQYARENDFGNSCTGWYNHVKHNNKLGDDFSMVSILLK